VAVIDGVRLPLHCSWDFHNVAEMTRNKQGLFASVCVVFLFLFQLDSNLNGLFRDFGSSSCTNVHNCRNLLLSYREVVVPLCFAEPILSVVAVRVIHAQVEHTTYAMAEEHPRHFGSHTILVVEYHVYNAPWRAQANIYFIVDASGRRTSSIRRMPVNREGRPKSLIDPSHSPM
jgi:hypothetical protein